tara:strand:- start:950 stop:1081 length:132 start_codon:yes stop_codon:yes gene_type:complete
MLTEEEKKSLREEDEMDEWRMRHYERQQQDLFDSDDWNWSGNR